MIVGEPTLLRRSTSAPTSTSTIEAVAGRFARRIEAIRSERTSGGSAGERREPSRRRMVISAAWGALFGAIPFLLVLWDVGVRPMRTALPGGIFSNFYDLQARAILDGRLDVPPGSLGIEAFVVDDRHFIYFPPFPALLRLPVLLVTEELDGKLTALSMLAAWVVLAVMSSLLIWRVRNLVTGDAPIRRFEAIVNAIVLASITGGSIVVFNASLPWVYHEAYAWATALAVGTLASLLAVLRSPQLRSVVVTGLFAIATILTRTTAGWACAAAIIAAGVWILTGRPHPGRSRAGWVVVAAGVIALLVGSAVNWAKFRHPYMFPLETQVWTDVNEHRRNALAANGGTLAGPQFFWTSLVTYFRPDGARFVSYFPWVTLPAGPPKPVGGAFLDQAYRTGSVPTFMPLLFLLAMWGCCVAARRHVARAIRIVRIPLLGALAITVGVMAYGFLANRYVSEFLPVLAVAGSLGAADVVRRLRSKNRAVKLGAVGIAALMALYGAWANSAAGVATARQTYGGERLTAYVATQAEVSGGRGSSFSALVRRSEDLPLDGPADELLVVGECSALFLASGDAYGPWIPLEVATTAVSVESVSGGGAPGTITLAQFEGSASRTVWLDIGGSSRYRLRITDGRAAYAGDWFAVGPGTSFTVSIEPNVEDNVYAIWGGDRLLATVPIMEWSSEWISSANLAELDLATEQLQGPAQVVLRPLTAPRLELCDDLVPAAVR